MRTTTSVVATLLLAIVIAVVALSSSHEQAHACACPVFSTASKLELSDSVFLGVVVYVDSEQLETKPRNNPQVFEDIVMLRAIQVWKGDPNEIAFIKARRSRYPEGRGPAGCSSGPPYNPGYTYVVFSRAHKSKLGCGAMTTHYGSEEAAEDLEALGPGLIPVPRSVGPIPERDPQPTEPPGSCNAPLGYAHGYADLSSFGLLAPLAWLAWRRRPRR